MSTVLQELSQAFRIAIRTAFQIDADPLLTIAQNEKFGDYQSNAAMGLARQVTTPDGSKTSPRAVAEKILQALDLGNALAEPPTIAGPGFINVRLSPAWLAERLRTDASGDRLGVPLATSPQTVVVDYSGPNIAKEMHVGHLRSTIVGDTLARVFEFQGHHVIRQNHIGDWGLQMGMVTWAVENSGEAPTDLARLEQLYRQVNKASEDPAVRKQMIERTRQLQQTPKEQLTAWQQVRTLTLSSTEQMYQRLGVRLTEADVRGESFYSDQYQSLIDDLRQKGIATDTDGAVGIFPPGFSNRQNEPRPFVIQSRDGTFQYPTFDLAALKYRVQVLHADRIIYTHDSRQAEHFAMLFAVAKMLGLDHVDGHPVELDYAPFGTVLGEDSRPLKSRSGENIKLAELVDEADQRAFELVTEKNPELPEAVRKLIAHAVGVGGVKYADLSRDRTSDYIFSWKTMLALDGNTAPYLQYAHARICSIFRRMQREEELENMAGAVSAAQPNSPAGLMLMPHVHHHNQQLILESPFELSLARHLIRFGDVIEQVERKLKPHHLCSYLYDLAGRFSGFFENCPVLKSEEPTRTSRLALCSITGKALTIGLDLLGIEHPDQM